MVTRTVLSGTQDPVGRSRSNTPGTPLVVRVCEGTSGLSKLLTRASHTYASILRTKLTEPALVIWTLDLLFPRVRVQTFIARGTVTILRIPPAVRHAS